MKNFVQSVLGRVCSFTKGTAAKPLYKQNFVIPGLGKPGDYCMKKIVNAVSSLGNALRVTRLKCERIECPNCYQWWLSQRVFKLAVLVECYSKVVRDRPNVISISLHEDEFYKKPWEFYLSFYRKAYYRIKKLGVVGGIRFFHPFRLKRSIKRELVKSGIFENGNGGAFWKAIRDDVLHLKSFYEYVRLSPHLHIIGFPSFIDENNFKDWVIVKYAVLDDVSDVVGHIKYLLDHSGILTDKGNEPASVFGVLNGFDPVKFLKPLEIIEIKKQVAEAMGLVYDEELDDIRLPVDEEEEEDVYDWIPLYEFADYSQEQTQFVNAFVTSIVDHDHRMIVDEVIELYNSRRTDSDLIKWERHVFLEDLREIPKGFEIVFVDEINKKDS